MRRFQPSVYGGLFIGILSALPIVGAANVCCCLWVVVGGLLTVYLQRQSSAEALDAAEAVLAGLVAGLIGAVIYVGFTGLMVAMSGEQVGDLMRRNLEQNPQVPPEIRDRLETIMAGRRAPLLISLVFAAVAIPTYAVFSMLGALLGLAFFRKPPTPPVQS
jgi:hypothetical protein